MTWGRLDHLTEAMDVPGGALVRSRTSSEMHASYTAPCFVPGVKLERTLQPDDLHRLVPFDRTAPHAVAAEPVEPNIVLQLADDRQSATVSINGDIRVHVEIRPTPEGDGVHLVIPAMTHGEFMQSTGIPLADKIATVFGDEMGSICGNNGSPEAVDALARVRARVLAIVNGGAS
jgi:hypothetical protein